MLRFRIRHTLPLLSFALAGVLAGCGGGGSAADTVAADSARLAAAPWADVLAEARGQTVDWVMWNGDPLINRYVQDYVVPLARDSFGVTVRVAAGQGNEIVTAIMSEREAAPPASGYDLMWINGETFYQLRQIGALYGPFADRLPNARYVDSESRFIATDFQQPVDGMESPWGNVQMALIYDTTRTPEPWQTRADLFAWAKAHPGRFTFDTQFTGMTFLKALLIDIAGGGASLDGPFDETKYQVASEELWAYLNALRPHLWKQGTTFPAGVAQLHQLYASGEVDFSMSNNDAEVDNKVIQGLFPPTSRAYVPSIGTIQNSHYVGIPRHAADKAGALVVANLLISPAAQLRKMDPRVWGDGTVLSMERLPPEWRARFEGLPTRTRAPRRADIETRARMELAPEYMIRLAADFRTRIVDR